MSSFVRSAATREQLEVRVGELEGIVGALSRGELDAMCVGESGEVVLLRDAQQDIISREAWYRSLFESSPLATLVHDRETGRILAANPAAVAQYGYAHEELLSLSMVHLRHPADRQRAAQALQAIRERQGIRAGTWRHVRKDGSTVDVEVVVRAIDFDGREAWLMIATDVTARLATERALRESEAHLARAQRMAQVSTWEWDVVADKVHVSAETAELFKGTAALSGRGLREFLGLVHSEDIPRVTEALQAVLARERPYDLVIRLVAPDGAVRIAHTIGDPDLENGRVVRLVGTIQDITEQHALQTQLTNADRMATVGALAAGVAHEINNPLAAVVMNAWLLRDALSRPGGERENGKTDGVDESLDAIRDGCERIKTIVGDLRKFSQQDDEKKGPVDIQRAIDSALNIASKELRHRARVVRDFQALPAIYGNEARLGQVFLNLILNAAHAITEGAYAHNEIRISTRTDEAGRALIEVADTGRGIAPDVLPRLFDPFFTERSVGAGTGLGLAIAHRIVHALGGEIQVTSEVAVGTTFRVLLPSARSASEPEKVPQAPLAESGVRGRVIVIDDEPAIVDVVKRTLSREHDVVTFTSARDAIAHLRNATADAILCDLMMPDMTGMDFYEIVARDHPELTSRLIFATGGVFTPRARSFLSHTAAACLEKPFRRPELMDAVRRAVVGARARESKEPSPATGADTQGGPPPDEPTR
jgi:PAS domain S-box-containing protein